MEGRAAVSPCSSFSPISFRQKCCVQNARKPPHWELPALPDLQWATGRIGMRSGKTGRSIGFTNPNAIPLTSQNCEKDGIKRLSAQNHGRSAESTTLALINNFFPFIMVHTVNHLTIEVHIRIHNQILMIRLRFRFLRTP